MKKLNKNFELKKVTVESMNVFAKCACSGSCSNECSSVFSMTGIIQSRANAIVTNDANS